MTAIRQDDAHIAGTDTLIRGFQGAGHVRGYLLRQVLHVPYRERTTLIRRFVVNVQFNNDGLLKKLTPDSKPDFVTPSKVITLKPVLRSPSVQRTKALYRVRRTRRRPRSEREPRGLEAPWYGKIVQACAPVVRVVSQAVGAWVQPSHSEEKQWMYTPTMRMRGLSASAPEHDASAAPVPSPAGARCARPG